MEREMVSYAEKFSRVIGVRDLGRCGFRVDPSGKAYLLEVNPSPHLARIGGEFVKAGEHHGLSYTEIIGRIIASAVHRHGLKR